MKERILEIFLNFIYRRKRNKSFLLIYLFFLPVSWIVAGIVFIKNKLYDCSILAEKKAKLPVVSIGNLLLGGAGKTPVLFFLIEALQEKNIAILSRAYKSYAEKKKKTTVTFPFAKTKWQDVGDEIQMLKNRYPFVWCALNKDRRQAALEVEDKVKLFIMDDGMQYRKLARDVNIVVVNGTEFSRAAKILPLGFLREKPSALQRADYIIYNVHEKNIFDEPIISRIQKYSQAPIIAVKAVAKEIRDKNNNVMDSSDMKAALFCGIAYPENFYKLVAEKNIPIVATWSYVDHHLPQEKDFLSFAQKMQKKEANSLLCTEKDFVKIPVHWQKILPIYYIIMSFDIIYGKTNWVNLVENIKKSIYS